MSKQFKPHDIFLAFNRQSFNQRVISHPFSSFTSRSITLLTLQHALLSSVDPLLNPPLSVVIVVSDYIPKLLLTNSLVYFKTDSRFWDGITSIHNIAVEQSSPSNFLKCLHAATSTYLELKGLSSP